MKNMKIDEVTLLGRANEYIHFSEKDITRENVVEALRKQERINKVSLVNEKNIVKILHLNGVYEELYKFE